MRPWNYHPDLTKERLVLLAQLLARGRRHALERHDPLIGDDAWTRGVRAFRFGCHEIAKAAGSDGFDWLVVLDPRRKFQFMVGKVPMRFYRGTPEDPKPNMLKLAELEQLAFPFAVDEPLANAKLRIAVETDEDGSVMAVFFVAIRGVNTETQWRIPYETAPPLLVDVKHDVAEAIELDAPEVGMLDDEEDEEKEEGGGRA